MSTFKIKGKQISCKDLLVKRVNVKRRRLMKEVSLLSPRNLPKPFSEYCEGLHFLVSVENLSDISFIFHEISEVRHCSGIEEGNINFARRVCGPKDIKLSV